MRYTNLFIVGAPKAGTTALYKYLEGHPEIFLSTPKEVNYFSKVELDEQKLYYNDFKVNDLGDYLKLFEGASRKQKVIGEASVSYLFYPNVAQKIYDFNSSAKIVILLRNPIERAWSHFLMDRKLGKVSKGFMEVYSDRASLNFQQYFELGKYYKQVKRYLDLFGDKVMIIFSDDLKKETHKIIAELFLFLEIQNIDVSNTNEHNKYKEPKGRFVKALYQNTKVRNFVKGIVSEKFIHFFISKLFTSTKPSLGKTDIEILKSYYLEDIQNLEKLLSIDLSKWK